MARGAIMCLFDGVLLGLLCSTSHALGTSMLGLKTPFANVAGSSALLAGKLGPAQGQNLTHLAFRIEHPSSVAVGSFLESA